MSFNNRYAFKATSYRVPDADDMSWNTLGVYSFGFQTPHPSTAPLKRTMPEELESRKRIQSSPSSYSSSSTSSEEQPIQAPAPATGSTAKLKVYIIKSYFEYPHVERDPRRSLGSPTLPMDLKLPSFCVIPPVMERQRQLFKHKVEAAVLVLGIDYGYTLTNGLLTISEDQNVQWKRQLLADIQKLSITHLFVLDTFTETRWKKVLREASDVEFLELKRDVRTTLLPFDPTHLGRCLSCDRMDCHRWMAVVGGIQQVFSMPVEPVMH